MLRKMTASGTATPITIFVDAGNVPLLGSCATLCPAGAEAAAAIVETKIITSGVPLLALAVVRIVVRIGDEVPGSTATLDGGIDTEELVMGPVKIGVEETSTSETEVAFTDTPALATAVAPALAPPTALALVCAVAPALAPALAGVTAAADAEAPMSNVFELKISAHC